MTTQSEQVQSMSKVSVKNDTLDLADLFYELRKGKSLVLLLMLVMGVVGFAYSLITDVNWSSSAIVQKAQIKDYAEYRDYVKQYQPIFNVYQKDGTIIVNDELNEYIESSYIFRQFRETFSSQIVKNEFWQQFGPISLTEDEKVEDKAPIDPDRLKIESRSNRFIVTAIADDADMSLKLLTEYLVFVNEKVRSDLMSNVSTLVNNKYNELTRQKEVLVVQAKNKIEAEKERLDINLKISNLNQTSSFQNEVESEYFNFEQSIETLKAKRDALNKINNYSIIEPGIQEVDAKLSIISSSVTKGNIKLSSFAFQKDPTLPNQPGGVGKTIIVLIFSLIGAISGVVLILIKTAVKQD